jgi:signal transduction histidine kinase/DNA-binding response OmpR family regulator/CHASE3 domain sensor protein
MPSNGATQSFTSAASPSSPSEPPQSSRAAAPSLRRTTLGGSLPPRTFWGFVAATFAVLIIAYLSYRSLESRTGGADRMTETLEVTQHLESLLSALKDAETGQRGYLLTGSERYLDPYEAASVSVPQEIAGCRRVLASNPLQLQRIDTIDQLAAQKMGELKQTVDLKRADRSDEALKIVRGDSGRALMDQVRGIVATMMTAERTTLADRTREWEESTSVSAIVTGGGSVLLLCLIFASAVVSSREFRAQEVEGWLRKGQTELGGRLQGDKSLEALGDGIVEFLSRYIGAQLGAVYFAETENHLKRVGAYAFPVAPLGEGESAPATAGLTRQALRSNEILTVSDVPKDYFPISSGLGSTQARNLLLAPVTADGTPNAVLEFAFFRPIAPHVLDLLRRSAEPIGVALRTTQFRRELVSLLEETQRQAEELQTQQEELRVQNDGLERHTRALQESQERLHNQQSELEQINSQLEEQTQALARQRDDLTVAQGELQRANTYKSEFLANMSHELRTPLNSSLILAKLLMDNRHGNLDEEQVKFAQTIYSAGNDLLTLINDILDLSKIEVGKLDVRPDTIVLSRMVDELESSFNPVAQDRKLDLTFDIDAKVPATMRTDPTRLQQILKNLLSNALKFTEHGGVSLHIHRLDEGRLAFDVKDTGIGIPEGQHDVIFEAFRQADGTTNRRYGGTGLGLSISRDLARLLGGELSMTSAPGRGSTFTLVLPEQFIAQQDGAGAREPARAALPPTRRLPKVPPPPQPPPAAPVLATAPLADDRERITPGSRALLIIEDDVNFARVIYDLARELEFSAVLAQSADEGLAMAERFRPSAIVLDVGLPDRSGLSVLDALKHSPTTRHIPVHMMSVSDYTQTALEMGATGYAVKPVMREQLVDALRRLETKFTQGTRRVLVVEDNQVHRESTCQLLAADDVETVAVGTAADALEKLGTTTFDCMVLDLSLPDQTGFELLEEMSQKEQYSFPPVIVYTGRSLSRDEEQTLRRFSTSIILKGARSPERLLDEVTLFLHQVEAKLPPDRQRMLRDARHREAVFEGRRVLVVEDDVRNIFALSSVLEPKGAKIEIARNGREALDALRDKPAVDLVLMDIMMPEMDGLQATRAIRKQPQFAGLPIIALTAKAMIDDREQCLAAGANDYIAKPLDVDKLLSLARVWMPK